MQQLPLLDSPPRFCQYTNGPCDQDFTDAQASNAVFLYPASPTQIAAAVEGAVERLRNSQASKRWVTWRDFGAEGQIVFCEISKALRFADTVVADITTLNFNLLFEIGYSIGLGKPTLLIRDTTYIKNQMDFEALGMLDTLQYIDFANGDELATGLTGALPGKQLPPTPKRLYSESPLYVLKGPISTEGTVMMLSTLKKSRIGFRTYDPIETQRLSLNEARKQVAGSVGIVAHLLSPNRKGALVHNAMCALVGGMAMAQQKVVVMLQEEHVAQPIDYRDVVKAYSDPKNIPALLEQSILQTVENMQLAAPSKLRLPETALERLDLGDPAAENEIRGLRDYFVRTGPFRQAMQGHARLVAGRKGTGKTAIFYEVRNAVGRGPSKLVLDLKPEGHQFTKLREAVLAELPDGVREHTVTAFWNYMLLSEIAHKILTQERRWAERDHDRWVRYQALEDEYLEHAVAAGDDLSQRLLRQVDRLVERYGELSGPMRDRVTEVIYGGDIRVLDDAVSDYLQDKDEVWLLIDNLDKSWATRGTTPEDILIVRGLLEATRKLQRQLEERDVAFKCLVFLRTDVYEHLVRETPDKDKDTVIRLDWDDPAVFHEIVRRRIESSTDVAGDFDEVWRALFASHIGAEDSFNYVAGRTLMRPRNLLKFVQGAVEVALNRGHLKVTAEDVLQAEQNYSQDLLLMTSFEVADTAPDLGDILFAFATQPAAISMADVDGVLKKHGLDEAARERAVDLLVWFGFLGIAGSVATDDQYAFQVPYSVQQLLRPVADGQGRFVLHPAFHAALHVGR